MRQATPIGPSFFATLGAAFFPHQVDVLENSASPNAAKSWSTVSGLGALTAVVAPLGEQETNSFGYDARQDLRLVQFNAVVAVLPEHAIRYTGETDVFEVIDIRQDSHGTGTQLVVRKADIA